MGRKTTLSEALSPYMDPFSAVQALMDLANRIDKAASRCGSTELTARECLRPLGLGTVLDLRGLQAQGLVVYQRGDTWYIDSRMFRRWVEGQIAKLKDKHASQPQQAFGQQQLF